MAYELKALLAKVQTFKAAELRYPVVRLSHGMALLPLTETIINLIGVKRFPLQDFYQITVDSNLDKLGVSLSLFGPVAFIQANIFGGIGDQASMVWSGGERIRLEVSKKAINNAIEDIDEDIWEPSSGDEFDTLDLGRFRYTSEWGDIAENLT
jgi:hypothetical protein